MRERTSTQEKSCIVPLFSTSWLMSCLLQKCLLKVFSGQIAPVNALSMTFYGIQYPFFQVGSAVLAVLRPSFLCTCSLAEHEKLKYP